ncbi:MAG: hypothetical protein ACLRNW_20385, partial [Neglectibacter sp.]
YITSGSIAPTFLCGIALNFNSVLGFSVHRIALRSRFVNKFSKTFQYFLQIFFNNFTFIMPYTTKKCILGSNMKAVSHFKIM